MTKDTTERTAELRKFSERKSRKWYAIAAQLDAVVCTMEEEGLDYGEVYESARTAARQARQTAAGYWADAKGAEDIITGKHIPLYSKKSK